MTRAGGAVDIRDLRAEEAPALGRLLTDVYSGLDGFPSPTEQPDYYHMLANVGDFAKRDAVRVLVALADGELAGGVVYFGDMGQYGSGGSAGEVRNAAGMRLLAVAPVARGRGVGRALTLACIGLAGAAGHREVVLHTTRAMQAAWGMYERLGFARSTDLDFQQGSLPVFGFRLRLDTGA